MIKMVPTKLLLKNEENRPEGKMSALKKIFNFNIFLGRSEGMVCTYLYMYVLCSRTVQVQQKMARNMNMNTIMSVMAVDTETGHVRQHMYTNSNNG